MPSLDRDRVWRWLFRPQTIRSVTTWVGKLGVPKRDRLDVTQCILLEAIKSFPTYDPLRSRPERWLNRIAVHVVAHYKDKAYRRHEVLAGSPGLKAVDDSASAVDTLLSEERRLFLLQVITRLPSDLAWMLVEHDLHGRSMRELAAAARLPVSTAYKWRARAFAAAQAVARELRETESLGRGKSRVGQRAGLGSRWFAGEHARADSGAIFRRKAEPCCSRLS